jgi:osmotically-inducible protein OsmY
MGWLQRMLGQETSAPPQTAPAPASGETIPPERLGLNGEYDQSGLAKRVAQAFDNDSTLNDVETLWVAQTGSTVILKGKVPNQEILNKMLSIGKSVEGATSVDTSQVTMG